jgi:hypothetical protein
MNRKNLFELFVKHSKKIDLMKIKTDFILILGMRNHLSKKLYV